MFLLMVHGINLSRRQLKRILQRRGLRRRGDASDAHEVFEALSEELTELTVDHGLVIGRQDVRTPCSENCRPRRCGDAV